MTQEETKRLYAAFEVLEGINPTDGNFNKREFAGRDGLRVEAVRAYALVFFC